MQGERTLGSSFIRQSLSFGLTEYSSLAMVIHRCLRLRQNVVGALRNVVECRWLRWSWVEAARKPDWKISGKNNSEN
jgi:hypothetical protein